MLKPFLRTILLASILFFLLVYMGMKYHWGDALKRTSSKTSQHLELNIPNAEELTVESLDSTVPIIDVEPYDTEDMAAESVEAEGVEGDESIDASKDIFQPEIIKNGPSIALIDAMTKDQLALQCQQLYFKTFKMAEDPSVELLVGNCVVSNYQEPFEESIKTPQMIQEEQRLKQRAISNCQYQILQPNNNALSGVEKQLLIGICVSNQVSQ
ncbi:MAG TPA: hypothetical protein EYH20_04520 [Leucothrix sp.]|nr:hypothetical protein [Leucothrix sp.]